MSLDDNRRLSIKTFYGVLNQPLFDGGCSQKARELLADGNIEDAIKEWSRLADLGSGNARCVLAYIHFRGAPTIAPDLHKAKALAVGATSTSRGYANYLLGCFALAEGSIAHAMNYLKISREEQFVPSLTLLAWVRFRYNAIAGKNQQNAEKLAMLAIKAGNVPARALLARIQCSGKLGLIKRFQGIVSMPFYILLGFLSTRSNVFSINCFHYSPTFKLPLFVSSS
jgi:TPR repeat protein